MNRETKYSKVTINDGIAYCIFKKIEEVDIIMAHAIVADRVDFFDNISYPCLFDITNIKKTTKEARDYLAKEGNELVVASAIVVSSPMLKMMANFYVMVNKPQNPSRLFTNTDEAILWLNQFKK